jgi:hypothetical protein
MRKTALFLICLAGLAGCAGDDVGLVVMRTLENTAKAACDAVRNCGTTDAGKRRTD